MPRKKDIVKRGTPVPRIRENATLLRTHESFVDLINGRPHPPPFLDVFDFFRTFNTSLQDDLMYSDDDDEDDEDEDDDDFYPCHAAYRPLEPHPRIRQLTDEEADQHAKQLIDEEERRKEKTEKNKRKKLRKKEKKRLEKENAVKDILPEEKQGKPDSSANQKQKPFIETTAEANESTESSETVTEAAGRSGNSKELAVKMNEKEDVERKELDLNNSYTSTAKSVPDEAFNWEPAKNRKKEKSKLVEIQQPKEKEKANIVEKLDVKKKKEDKHETNKEEKPVDPTTEEFAKRSRELAAMGNRLAACGQFEMAVKCFTDAIKFNPKEYKLFGNRSLCYERMQQYENALRDADLALCMEPGWVKGLFRKGKALCGLKKYYEASLIYVEVLKLDSSSAEAKQELKRAQTLHLMEMGFSWEQSLEALKTHGTLEEAVEALFGGNIKPASASEVKKDEPVVQEEDADDGEWIVQQTSRSRMQQVKESDALSQSRSNSQSPTPQSRSSIKPELFSVWVGSLAPAVTYSTLHELFSRVGVVYSIKMLLEHQCAFVNYMKKEDCDKAIQSFNGLVVEGAPLSVRYPSKNFTGLGSYKKECFFWRTTGCTRQDCTYKHVPEHKNIDRDKFTSRLGRFNV
ncbi:hsp70-Hsp90 organizing protein 2-like [Anabas testudineus]|uniref:Uncharacterized protein n=1 Tax=Anabas testudineus TaxID=64144 RepID=A0A3Q1IYG8_ANATE|nr:hsp70-Hsp90 organizing protein 2-like [Anabas testudineus]